MSTRLSRATRDRISPVTGSARMISYFVPEGAPDGAAMAITSPFPARPNPAYTRSALITVRQTPDAPGDGAGDDEGWVVGLAEAPGPTVESEAAGEALGTS